jgi:hypothetical protein
MGVGNSDPFGSPRSPRPKGSQRGTVKRSHQKGPINTGGGLAGGCLMALVMLPFTAAWSLIRRK